MRVIKATKKQIDAVLKCHNGVGHMLYKVGNNTTCEVEFFIKHGIPHRIMDGKPIEYNIDDDEDGVD